MKDVLNKEDFYLYLKHQLGGLNINDNTCFFDPIGLDGFEAECFMMKLRDDYNVDLAKYNPYDFHLNDIDAAGPRLLINVLLGRVPKFPTFTALHLYQVVQAKQWFFPPNNISASSEKE
jgi:hypothetical protein